MPHWAALLLDARACASPTEAARGLAGWALQFTPRVAQVDEALVLEVEASLRLFGGAQALRDRIGREAADLGVVALAWAPTSLGALALARSGVADGFARPLAELLDRLAVETLTASRAHLPTLERLGCRCLGDMRRLPRGGMSRRFGAEVLAALDQAYGSRPDGHAWIELPETFESRLELPGRVDQAPALAFGARRLLLQMSGWLAARHAGVVAFTLRWRHDAMRAREVGDGGELLVRTAEPTRSVEHLGRLLTERLAHVQLAAAVGELQLLAVEVRALEEVSGLLLPDPGAGAEPLHLVLERIAARLGAERVRQPVVREDHRPEWMQEWLPADAARPRRRAGGDGMPQPSWLLRVPLRLAVRGERPLYQGELQLLSGPHRIEGGWWHRLATEDGVSICHVQRDYWVAFSEHAGLLWVYRERLAGDEPGWFLAGVFG